MFSAESEEPTALQDIYIGLPQESLLSAFPGSQEIKRIELPDYLATWIAREDGFRQSFPDMAAKQRTKYG
jgi:hypothetical protein